MAEQRGEQSDATVAILNTSGMNDRVQQQTLHIDKNMPFLALDQFACIEPVRINTAARDIAHCLEPIQELVESDESVVIPW